MNGERLTAEDVLRMRSQVACPEEGHALCELVLREIAVYGSDRRPSGMNAYELAAAALEE